MNPTETEDIENPTEPEEVENAPEDESAAFVYDGQQKSPRPTVSGAVRRMMGRRPKIRPKGIFHHPATWDQEELDFIADCLKQNIPIYTIANMVHCERHSLSNLINSSPELKQLKDDKYENLLDEAEYQADRLMKAGNASIVIHVLQTLGRKRGWTEESAGNNGGNEGRIIMGLIPDEEVEKANEQQRALKQEVSTNAIDPMRMALTEEAVKAEVDRRMNIVEVEEAGSAVRENRSRGDLMEEEEMEIEGSYMATNGGGMQQEVDPWADGANSMFFQ